MNRKYMPIAFTGAALLAVLFALFVLIPRGPSASKTTSDSRPTPSHATPAPMFSIEPAEDGAAEPPPTTSAAMEQTRAHYLEYAKYPPWSRPATPQYAELYDFNQKGPVDEQAIGSVGRAEIHARVALDKVFVEPGRTAMITAEAWTMQDGVRGKLDYDVVAEVQISTAEAKPSAGAEPIDIGFRTSQGSLVMTHDSTRRELRVGRLDVANFAALAEKPRAARLLVWIQTPSGETKPLMLPFMYSTKAPLRVIGIAGERIVNGSLEITLDVDIAAKTPVRLRGALAQAGRLDQPIATYDRWIQPVEAGRQQVTLQFFGKILYDADRDGPYELYRVHGSAFIAGAQLPEVFFQDDHTFRTRAYRADQFAADEWTDPEKDQKLQMYAEVIGSLRASDQRP